MEHLSKYLKIVLIDPDNKISTHNASTISIHSILIEVEFLSSIGNLVIFLIIGYILMPK